MLPVTEAAPLGSRARFFPASRSSATTARRSKRARLGSPSTKGA